MRPFEISSRASTVAASISSRKYTYKWSRLNRSNETANGQDGTYGIIRELLTELSDRCEIFNLGSADAISARQREAGLLERLWVAKRVVRGVERLGLDGAFDELRPVPGERLDELCHAEDGEDALRRDDVEEMFREKPDARGEP
jgi:hypothetical protein